MIYYAVDGDTVKSNKMTAFISERLPVFVLVLCVIQPIMDVISYFVTELSAGNTLTLVLRMAVLCLTVLLGFLVAPSKKPYYIMSGTLILLTIFHAAICLHYGYASPVSDIANLIRIYSLPLTTLSFITFFKVSEKSFESMKKGFLIALLIIIAVEIISVITKTNPYTYPNKSVGILGWFYFANSQSAILSMLVPVTVIYAMKDKKLSLLQTALIAAAGSGTLYFLATRLAYAALVGTMAGLAVSCVIVKYTRRVACGKDACKAAWIYAACALLALCFVGLSPMQKNSALVAENAVSKQEHIDSLVAADSIDAESETEALRSAYEHYLPGPTLRFGLQKTAEFYEYSTDVSDLGDVRRQKITYCRFLMEEKPLSRLFGLSLADMEHEGKIYDVENDFHGIYFLSGIVGLILMISFFAFFIYRIIRALINNFRRYFTLEAAAFGISLICGLLHAYFTAGVLRRPNAGFYLAVVLAAVYVMTVIKNDATENENNHENDN